MREQAPKPERADQLRLAVRHTVANRRGLHVDKQRL